MKYNKIKSALEEKYTWWTFLIVIATAGVFVGFFDFDFLKISPGSSWEKANGWLCLFAIVPALWGAFTERKVTLTEVGLTIVGCIVIFCLYLYNYNVFYSYLFILVSLAIMFFYGVFIHVKILSRLMDKKLKEVEQQIEQEKAINLKQDKRKKPQAKKKGKTFGKNK